MLAVKQLSVQYEDAITALDGVQLEMQPRSIVALVGPNGAGKSTLMRVIAGVLSAYRGRVVGGEVWWKDRRIERLDPTVISRAGISLVQEGREIFRHLTVEENLKVATLFRPRGGNDNAVMMDEVFHYFPALAKRRRQQAGYLSGGEAQMLAIGMALMTGAELILLDEPSLGLAPRIVDVVFETVDRIHRERQTSFLIAEQVISRVISLAERCYVLVNGRVAVVARPEELDRQTLQRAYLGVPS